MQVTCIKTTLLWGIICNCHNLSFLTYSLSYTNLNKCWQFTGQYFSDHKNSIYKNFYMVKIFFSRYHHNETRTSRDRQCKPTERHVISNFLGKNIFRLKWGKILTGSNVVRLAPFVECWLGNSIGERVTFCRNSSTSGFSECPIVWPILRDRQFWTHPSPYFSRQCKKYNVAGDRSAIVAKNPITACRWCWALAFLQFSQRMWGWA